MISYFAFVLFLSLKNLYFDSSMISASALRQRWYTLGSVVNATREVTTSSGTASSLRAFSAHGAFGCAAIRFSRILA
jgi:hypothetical protein